MKRKRAAVIAVVVIVVLYVSAWVIRAISNFWLLLLLLYAIAAMQGKG